MRCLVPSLSCLLIVVWAGCAGYKLGPTSGAVAGARSIQINFFRNETLEPRLSEPLTSALRKRLLQEGTFRLNSHGDGDIVVNGVITKFNRSHLSFQPTDVLTVRDYNLSLVARVVVVDRSAGKTMLDREVGGRTTIRVGVDLGSAERQAIPLLAEDLARNIASLLVDGEW